MSGEKTIKERLEYLNETKRQMRQALISKGIVFDTNGHKYDDFRSYVQKIKDITVNEAIDVQSIDITENGDYEANSGVAYNPIHVEVKPNTTTKSVSKDGTYRAKDDGADGYSEVSVSVGSSLGTKSITSEDLPDDPGTPKTFKASDEGKDVIGWKEVSVNISGKIAESEPIEVDATNYGLERTYEAKDQGLWGFSKVKIIIKEAEGPFSVEYWDGTAKLAVVSVPKNGTAIFPDAYPTKEGQTFVRWNPEPKNVTMNLKCYAEWKDATEGSSGGGTGGGANMTWTQISQANGQGINVGDTKKLKSKTFTYDKYTFKGFSVTATCISNENGSTWSATIPLDTIDGSTYHLYAYSNPISSSYSDVYGATNIWENSLLQSQLFNSIVSSAITNGNADQGGVNLKAIDHYVPMYEGDNIFEDDHKFSAAVTCNIAGSGGLAELSYANRDDDLRALGKDPTKVGRVDLVTGIYFRDYTDRYMKLYINRSDIKTLYNSPDSSFYHSSDRIIKAVAEDKTDEEIAAMCCDIGNGSDHGSITVIFSIGN